MKILYVGRDNETVSSYCPGSLVCMAILEKLHADIQVQDCHILRESTVFPEWLNGTPIFIDRDVGVPLRGKEAVRHLQALLKEEEEAMKYEEQQQQLKAKAKAPSQGASPRMAQPVPPSRQPAEEEPLEVNAIDSGEEPMDAMANGAGNAPLRDDKVTDDELQRFMEARKQSPATASAQIAMVT